MKKITVSQLVKLIKNATITARSEIFEIICYGDNDESDIAWGWIWNELVVEGLKIKYQNSYEHPDGKPSLATISSDVPDIWEIEQQDFVVADDDGYELDIYDIGAIIIEHTDIDSLDLTVLGEDEE